MEVFNGISSNSCSMGKKIRGTNAGTTTEYLLAIPNGVCR